MVATHLYVKDKMVAPRLHVNEMMTIDDNKRVAFLRCDCTTPRATPFCLINHNFDVAQSLELSYALSDCA